MTNEEKRQECDTCEKAERKQYARETVPGGKTTKTLIGLTCCGGPAEWMHTFDKFPLQFNPIHKPSKCDKRRGRE